MTRLLFVVEVAQSDAYKVRVADFSPEPSLNGVRSRSMQLTSGGFDSRRLRDAKAISRSDPYDRVQQPRSTSPRYESVPANTGAGWTRQAPRRHRPLRSARSSDLQADYELTEVHTAIDFLGFMKKVGRA